MRYTFIHHHRAVWPVTVMAKVLEVSTSGYYAWIDRPPSSRTQRRDQLANRVKEVFKNSHEIYGSRKIAAELVDRNVKACRNTIARIMSTCHLRSRAQKRRRFVVTTNSNHDDPIAPNRLGRCFIATAPNQKWVADITYVKTQHGFAYLAAVMDLFSRRIVGWAVSDSLETSLVLKALEPAIHTRRPGRGLMHHSDRGGQYTGDRYRRLLDRYHIECSMSRRGDCWDNAPMERFMNSLKNEWTNHRKYHGVEEVRTNVFKYIEMFYNRKRRHQALDYMSPAEFEAKHASTTVA